MQTFVVYPNELSIVRNLDYSSFFACFCLLTEYVAVYIGADPAVGEGLSGRVAGLKAMHAGNVKKFCQIDI